MLNHWHSRSALLALFGLTYFSAAALRAEDRYDSGALPTYRSTVSEVRVTFFATDEKNHPLETLTKSDFAIIDNEQVVRNFRSLQHSAETSLDVVVLVDMSESVAPRFRVAISDVLQLVAREQSIPDDDIAVLSFGGTFGGTPDIRATLKQTSAASRPAILCSSDCRASDSVAKLQAMKSGGVTPLYDALIFASDLIANHRRADGRRDVRPILILFTDGADNFSLHSAREALQAAQDAGALIYSVDIGASENASGGVFLQQVSYATGGRYFPPRSSLNDGAASILNTVLEDLRASYVVTYDLPSHQAGLHALRLLPTHNLNLTFHSRNGYSYESSGQ